MKYKEKAEVREISCIAEDIYSLYLAVSFSEYVKAGQFVSLFVQDSARLLPRPISVCETVPEKGEIRLVFRIAGYGTGTFAHLKEGELIEVMGPLGNGFPMDECAGKRLLLVGGGIGIPPMMSVAKEFLRRKERENGNAVLPASVEFAAGYRTNDCYLLPELQEIAPVHLSSDDGSIGVHGTVIDALTADRAEADIVFACGPKPMLRAVAAWAKEREIPCYVSMEERMACGIGACLGCVCKTTSVDPHSQVKNARVCTDGPVFAASEVEL